jgi:transcription antitermination factor NusB
MGTRRKGREVALQVLYLADIGKVDPEKALRSLIREDHGIVEKKSEDFALQLALGAWSHRAELDVLIQKYAKNWELNRMAALDRNLLRMGAYELVYNPATPVSVIIDEAVEIAKTFSTEESGKFVNGILDQLKKERPAA